MTSAAVTCGTTCRISFATLSSSLRCNLMLNACGSLMASASSVSTMNLTPRTGSGRFRWVVPLLRWNTLAYVFQRQSQLPRDAKPLGLVLYADKTKLSSFGTEKGYPIIARVANLPTYIRNGEGPGGGRVVGWLPIVSCHLSGIASSH